MMHTTHISDSHRPAFTLIELLVVVGVLAILMAIAGYGVMRARNFARDTADNQLLESIENGLSAYQREIGSLPPSLQDGVLGKPEKWYGCQMLAQAMLGRATTDNANLANIEPIDLYEGPGFRLKARGKVYGPYLEAGTRTNLLPTATGEERLVIVDANDNPILYYLARTDASGNLLDDPMFDTTHNPDGPGGATPPPDAVDEYVKHGIKLSGAMKVSLKDRSDIPRYLLLSPGPDSQWDAGNGSNDVNNLDWSK